METYNNSVPLKLDQSHLLKNHLIGAQCSLLLKNIYTLLPSLFIYFHYNFLFSITLLYHQNCPNVSQCGQQPGSLHYGTSPCLTGGHPPMYPRMCLQACQQGHYHSLPRSDHNPGLEHSHALSHMHEHNHILSNAHSHAHNHNHAHNHIGSLPVCRL